MVVINWNENNVSIVSHSLFFIGSGGEFQLMDKVATLLSIPLHFVLVLFHSNLPFWYLHILNSVGFYYFLNV